MGARLYLQPGIPQACMLNARMLSRTLRWRCLRRTSVCSLGGSIVERGSTSPAVSRAIPNRCYVDQVVVTDYESGGQEFESLRARQSTAQTRVGRALFPRCDPYDIVV